VAWTAGVLGPLVVRTFLICANNLLSPGLDLDGKPISAVRSATRKMTFSWGEIITFRYQIELLVCRKIAGSEQLVANSTRTSLDKYPSTLSDAALFSFCYQFRSVTNFIPLPLGTDCVDDSHITFPFFAANNQLTSRKLCDPPLPNRYTLVHPFMQSRYDLACPRDWLKVVLPLGGVQAWEGALQMGQ
jgi:hypothetical protein